jgi:uncharacterized membrane protein
LCWSYTTLYFAGAFSQRIYLVSSSRRSGKTLAAGFGELAQSGEVDSRDCWDAPKTARSANGGYWLESDHTSHEKDSAVQAGKSTLTPSASSEARRKMTQPTQSEPGHGFDNAQIGALAHMFRAEVYRSTAWRMRFDTTTNWAVVTTGIAMSASFSSAQASPLPLVLVGLLVSFFLLIEARRYRYFDIWRVRARVLETEFCAPLLAGELGQPNSAWAQRLALDYCEPRHRLGYARAIGRRLRSNYAWIFAIQMLSYYGKIAIHPTPLANLADLWQRAAVGPISGQFVVLAGAVFFGGWFCVGVVTLYQDRLQQTSDWQGLWTNETALRSTGHNSAEAPLD